MFRVMKWATPLLALGLIVSLSAVRASAEESKEKKETGSVSGTVTAPDGKPAAGVNVRVFHPMEKGERKAAKGESKPEAKSEKAQTNAAEGEKPAKGDKEKMDKPIPVASGTTDNDGKFTLKDVPIGKYTIIAQQRGVGRATEDIEIKTGEEKKVELKLARKSGSNTTGDTAKKPEKSSDDK